jgi:heme/copper-type cytochrome/quinol oxidase subunit 1
MVVVRKIEGIDLGQKQQGWTYYSPLKKNFKSHELQV